MKKEQKTLLAIAGAGIGLYLLTRKQQPAKSGTQLTDGGGEGQGNEVEGCTNIYATNYDATATIDNGTCVYDVPSVPLDQIWTLNPSGELNNAGPILWYLSQRLGMDVSTASPCDMFTWVLANNQYQIGSGALLDMISVLPNTETTTYLTGDEMNDLITGALWNSQWDGGDILIYDPATGMPLPDLTPYTADCTTELAPYYPQTYAEFRTFVETWMATTGGGTPPINPPSSTRMMNVDTGSADTCTLLGFMDNDPQMAGIIATIPNSHILDLGNYLSIVAGWNDASNVSDPPFDIYGNYNWPYSEVENILLPGCTEPTTDVNDDGTIDVGVNDGSGNDPINDGGDGGPTLDPSLMNRGLFYA